MYMRVEIKLHAFLAVKMQHQYYVPEQNTRQKKKQRPTIFLLIWVTHKNTFSFNLEQCILIRTCTYNKCHKIPT